MFNLGGPRNLEEVESFLLNMFADPDFIKMPNFLRKIIPRLRSKAMLVKKYEEIGGGSPLADWTDKQGEAMCQHLNAELPEQGPFKHYLAFQYNSPTIEEAMEEAKKDGVERIIGFSQYPQYSCSTTAGSLKEFHRVIKLASFGQSKVSVIDRWYNHPGYIDAMTGLLAEDLQKAFPHGYQEALLLFTAHSLPQFTVAAGD